MGSSALGAQLLVPWPARAAGGLLSGNNAHMSRFEGGARLSCDMGEWNIDASRFGGRPRFFSSVNNGLWHLELQGALFPGTGLPADFQARSWREAGVRWLLVKFPSFGFAARVPLEAWLQGRARAVSAAHFDALALSGAVPLNLQGGSEVEFFPSWLFHVRGQNVARWTCAGADAFSSCGEWQLLTAGAPALQRDAPPKGTRFRFERKGHAWPATAWLRDLSVLEARGEPFDTWVMEAGEDCAHTTLAWMGAGTQSSSQAALHLRALNAANGGAWTLPLLGARWAGSDDGETERALVARIGEAELGPKDVRAASERATSAEHWRVSVSGNDFKMSTRGHRLHHWQCEPFIGEASGALPETQGQGALSTQLHVPDGARAHFAPPLLLASTVVARLDGHATPLDEVPLQNRPIVRIPPRVRIPPLKEPAPTPTPTSAPTPTPTAPVSPTRRPLPNLGDILKRRAPIERVPPNPIVITPIKPNGRPPIIASNGHPPVIVIDPGIFGGIVNVSEPQVTVVRPDDLLVLKFRFRNLQLQNGALTRKAPGVATVIVEFPPQSVAEEAWFADKTPLFPAKRCLSGPSQLVFRLPADVAKVSYTLESLLDWDRWELVSKPGASSDADPATALEIPCGLTLAPFGARQWNHSAVPKTFAGRTELWHTRLADDFASPAATSGAAVPQTRAFPQIRPHGAHKDLRDRILEGVHPVGGAPIRIGKTPPSLEFRLFGQTRLLRAVAASPIEVPFPTSLTLQDRTQLVELMTAPNRWFEAEALFLTALGGTLKGRTQGAGWNPNELPPRQSLSEWQHRANLGRDFYVRTVREGFLFPFGHPAALVKITERKFETINNRQVAVLRQRQYVIVRQPEKTYRGGGLPDNLGRQMPFNTVRITTSTTPDLDPAQAILTPIGQTTPFAFHLIGFDDAGQKAEWAMPLIWMERSGGPSANLDGPIQLSADNALSIHTLMLRWAAHPEARADLGGQKVALAAPNVPGDTTFAAQTITFGALPKTADPSREAPFSPVVLVSDVNVPALQNLTGDKRPARVRHAQTFVQQGFGAGNAGEVVLELVEGNANALSAATQVVKLGAQSAGGLVQPALGMSGLSRKLGPVGGDLQKIAGGVFHPSDYFGAVLDEARLLGGIKLGDVLKAAGLDLGNAPKMITETVQDATAQAANLENAIPREVRTRINWQTNELVEALAFKPRAGAQLIVAGELVVKPTGATTKITGSLSNFDFDFFGFVVVSFNLLEFIAQSGKKLDVNCKLTDNPVAFGGPLSFIQTLADIIPADRLSDPPSLDISPMGVTVGYDLAIPDITAGAWGFANLKFGAGLTIPFSAQPARLRFNFCSRQDPMAVMCTLLTGGGFCALALGTDGVEEFEASFEVGGSIRLNFGVAKGAVYIMAGIYFELRQAEHAIVLAGYVRAGGSFSVLGLVSISLEMLMQLSYDSGSNMVTGSVEMSVKVSIAFFSKSVSFSAHKEFEAPATIKKGADAIVAELPAPDELHAHHALHLAATHDHWAQVCAAYA